MGYFDLGLINSFTVFYLLSDCYGLIHYINKYLKILDFPDVICLTS